MRPAKSQFDVIIGRSRSSHPEFPVRSGRSTLITCACPTPKFSRTIARLGGKSVTLNSAQQKRDEKEEEKMDQVNLEQIATPDDKINWTTATFMVLFHLGAVAALFFFTWTALFVAAFLWWLSTSLGVGVCYHRLLTHRGYKTPRWVEYVLTVFATLSLEGGPIFWVATHRIHHKFSDQDGDPHSPRDGKWWAHAGWILVGDALRQDVATLKRYVPDLAGDNVHVWLTKYHLLPTALLGVALYAIGGFRLVLWGICFRAVVGLHATWIVNSVAHIWGSRRFKTRDTSTNNWWVALISFGDGWHNNHHAYPVSARHGFEWYEIDFNWYTIWIFKQLGLVSRVHSIQLAAGTYAKQS